MKRFVKAATCFLAALLAAGCGSRPGATESDIPSAGGLRNIDDASPALRAAARAVVKIETRGSAAGTGCFVAIAGQEGLLLTNNHVLGFDLMPCAREGCYVKLHFDQQWGTEPKDPVEVFAQPLNASPELDTALYQVWKDGSRAEKFSPPHRLPIRPVSADEMVREGTVHMIGHPGGHLKKWSTGRVFAGEGGWIHSSLPGLGGSSGSPYLDEQGRVIGIHHHGKELYTRHDILFHAYGSSGASLAAFVAERDDTRFHAIRGRHPSDEIARSHFAYLFAHQGTAELSDGTSVAVPAALGAKCDEFIATSYRSVELVEQFRHWCVDSVHWLNCTTPEDGRGYKFCPVDAELARWRGRFEAFSEKIRAYHARDFLATLNMTSFLAPSGDAATTDLKSRLDAHLTRHRPVLTFDLAGDLLSAEGAGARYGGVSVADFLRNYRAQPHYEFRYDYIIPAHEQLFSLEALSREEIEQAFRSMLADPRIDMMNRLLVEATAHRHRLLR